MDIATLGYTPSLTIIFGGVSESKEKKKLKMTS